MITIKFADVLARMNEMLRRRRCFFVSPAIDRVLEGVSFAVCLGVVYLEAHLLDNTGPLTRDTAVRYGTFLFKNHPFYIRLACNTFKDSTSNESNYSF